MARLCNSCIATTWHAWLANVATAIMADLQREKVARWACNSFDLDFVRLEDGNCRSREHHVNGLFGNVKLCSMCRMFLL